MALTDLLGKKNANGKPHIETVMPPSALPGGEVRIVGSGLRPAELRQPSVRFGGAEGAVVISSDEFLVARVPEGASSGPVTVATNGASSNGHQINIAEVIADNLHPVTNPAVDSHGNIFVTFSGPRGQKVPVSVYKIAPDYSARPFLTDLMNATAIAFDRAGQMYVSSRYEGTVFKVAPNGNMSTYVESMGVATGLAFDKDENLYVGDRSGAIFKINRERQTFVFATLEPSVSAYHLAFRGDGHLFVSGPTTSSFDSIYGIDPQGNASIFFRGLRRPQGIAFDAENNLYVAASLGGKRGIVRITPDRQAALVVSGSNLVGLAFAPGRSVILATNNAAHHLSWVIQGKALLG